MIAALLFAGIGSSCDRSISAPPPNVESVVISNIAPSNLQKDSFTTNTAVIDAHTLTMTVSSGGGCREHDYTLTMTPAAFMESFPVQANLYLWHDAKNDPCDAIITDSLVFDLTPIAQLYRQMYGPDGEVALNLFDFEQMESTRLILEID